MSTKHDIDSSWALHLDILWTSALQHKTAVTRLLLIGLVFQFCLLVALLYYVVHFHYEANKQYFDFFWSNVFDQGYSKGFDILKTDPGRRTFDYAYRNMHLFEGYGHLAYLTFRIWWLLPFGFWYLYVDAKEKSKPIHIRGTKVLTAQELVESLREVESNG